MEDRSYATVGWLAITAGLLALPLLGLGILTSIPEKSMAFLLPVLIPLTIVQTGLSLYALYRLRGLLNERYQFHDVDQLIPVIIVGASLITLVGMVGKIAQVLRLIGIPGQIGLIALIALIGIPLSVVGIIFALKLLRLQDDLHGLLKPFAYTNIAACVLFATMLLAFLGLLVDGAATMILGVIFLRAARGAPEVEFV